MKGGITSGVVYPLAVTKLAEKFSFRNIGGTSAGAIAAAAAAAAELGRYSGGFEELRKLPDFLGGSAPDGSGSNLLAFFQPQPQTRRLFKICISALGGGGFRAIACRALKATANQFRWWTFLGTLPALAFMVWACVWTSGVFLAACLVAALALLICGVLGCLVWAVMRSVQSALPENFYGLCSGMTDAFRDRARNPPPSQQGKPLTYWLTEYLDTLAGRKPEDRPLTFGDLWGDRDADAERRINLEMMTTCITHGRPYRLPFRDDDDIKENGLFYFSPTDFRCLFPERVVKWMEDNPRSPSGQSEQDDLRREALKAKGFQSLPDPFNMPVVVAVRMSLSFPILLSAVPLYSVDRDRDPDGESPERCWFTDGGVCSNFPIHFFDAPIPRWPTLSINLIPKPRCTPSTELDVPEMAKSNGDMLQERWNRFEVKEEAVPGSDVPRTEEKSGLGKTVGFLNALITTMQNWSDNTQSRLPGYRDRIAGVGLSPEEGGLNLTMPKKRIEDLTKRGGAVAEEFINRFATPNGVKPPEMNWDNHRWLRMRSLLASLEQTLRNLERSCAHPQECDLNYEAWIAETKPGKAPSYQWKNEKQHQLALNTLKGLRELARQLRGSQSPVSIGAPHPRPELRTRPQI